MTLVEAPPSQTRAGGVGLFLWARRQEDMPAELERQFSRGRWLEDVVLVGPNKRGKVRQFKATGWWLPADRAAEVLATLSLGDMRHRTASVAVWTLASKWVIEAVARQQLVPSLLPGDDEDVFHARWRAAPVRPDDRARIAGLVSAMPGVARACPVDLGDKSVRTATAALHDFVDAAVDGLMRADTQAASPQPPEGPSWARRLAEALGGPDDRFQVHGLADRSLPEALDQWIASAVSLSSSGRPVVGFRLEEPPESDDGVWRITYHLIAPGGDARLSVADLWRGDKAAKETAQAMTRPEESLLEGLARAGRVFAPIIRSLDESQPYGVVVSAQEAWDFLTQRSLQLERAGYHVEAPKALSKVGRRRVRARMRIGELEQGGRGRSSGLLEGVIQYRWEASLGDDSLTAAEFLRLAASKAPLVLHRGVWIAVDPDEVARIKSLVEKGGSELDAAEALRLALLGEVPVPDAPGVSADVIAEGSVQRALEIVSGQVEPHERLPIPDALSATLRPYQERGFNWLESVTHVGFGACLADDMGLGKTVQVLTHMLHIAQKKRAARFLVVCPTSVIGNWCREIRRFVPTLAPIVHHGASRPSSKSALKRRIDDRRGPDGAIVVTSYALVRGDQAWLSDCVWDMVVLDEAQNIKNPEAGQSRAVRRLQGRRRAALTGTPVENRLTELWSIMDFLNPGLLGSQGGFKKKFAVPVERYGDDEAAALLRRVTSPFILRRLKTDPNIAPELPDKFETVRYCPLSREQAGLYQAAIDRGMDEIRSMDQGIERRGKVLAMLTELKQICNHPAHFLKDQNLTARRSGKMVRFLELVDEVVDNEGHALVFTQYREMGELLSLGMARRIGAEVPFLHGGLSRQQRERLVADFQHPMGPPAMVVSLRAGGTGLNLTRANHVFHYDRWWNPAVEDQATDRAFRIGQDRDVTVHRMVSQGTLEEQIHRILEEKRTLADRVIGSGETWLGELDDDTLGELVSLGQDAVLEEEL